MASRIGALFLTLVAVGLVNGYYFTYTINNNVLDTHFRHSLNLTIQQNSSLIYYMEMADKMATDNFTNFTTTYMDSKYGVGDVWNGTLNWLITNNGAPLGVGVSAYVPEPNDDILFNLTVTKSEPSNQTQLYYK